MENENQIPKRKDDCLIDWDHYEVADENGGTVIDVISKEQQQEWLEEECFCDEQYKADKEMCSNYYTFNYDKKKLEAYYRASLKHFYPDLFAYWGLIKMFNDGWIKTPAYVNWSDFSSWISPYGSIKSFIHEIADPRVRVEILDYIIRDADTIFTCFSRKRDLPEFKSLLLESKEAAKVYKQRLKDQEAAAKAKQKAKKEKPEYVLSVEEIIQYVREENPDAAPAVRAMLRYFADEKEGWNSKSVKALLEPIKAQNINIYAPVGQVNANVEHQTNTLRE